MEQISNDQELSLLLHLFKFVANHLLSAFSQVSRTSELPIVLRVMTVLELMLLVRLS